MNRLRKCLACSKELKGRTDKKFCDDACRSHFHNRDRRLNQCLSQHIWKSLQKNRKLLLNLAPNSATLIELQAKGFDCKFFTHFQKDGKGRHWRMIFDLGYRKDPKGNIHTFHPEKPEYF